MREILFGGQTKSDKKWIYGDLLHTDNGTYVIQNYAPFDGIGKYEVDTETICQYTGLADNTKWEELPENEKKEFLLEWNYKENRRNKKEDWNGRKIFEGDIVKTSQYGVDDGNGHNYAGFDTFSVEFSDGGFCLKNKWRRFNLRPLGNFEIIGNIFDNPELIGE